jgi:hypothetical protein
MSINIDALAPGEDVIYAECGSLARLRQTTAKRPDPRLEAAQAGWEAALVGRVDLVQRRCESGFQYLAIARHEVDRRPVLPVLASQGVRAA